jgi:hypothetical protein
MPLARILTHHPERTTALSQQLEQQGYRVEVHSPEQVNLAPADLEIEFEICERSDVLERAADLAMQLEADVAVAPGALQPAMAQISDDAAARDAAVLQSRAAQERVLELNPKLNPVRTPEGDLERNPERDPEREFEAAFASASEPAVSHRRAEPEMDIPIFHDSSPESSWSEIPVEAPLSNVVDMPVMEQSPLPPVAMLEEPPARPPDPVPYLAQLTPFGTPHAHAEESAEPTAHQQEHAHASRPRPEPAEGGALQRGASGAARVLAGARALAAATAESFRDHLQEYRKLAQLRSAEARAAREARLLDLEQRRAEAQQRATELEAAREAAAARLVELVRQRDPGLREESLRQESLREESLSEESLHGSIHQERGHEVAPIPAALPRSRPMESFRQASIASMRARTRRLRRSMSPQLRAVLTGAAAVSVLFVIGIILGAFYPRAPLANPNGVTTKTGGVTVQGGGVTVKTGGVTTPAAPAPKPSAAAQPVTQQPSAAATQPAAPAATKPSPRVAQGRRLAAQQEEQSLGDDVVIRHFSRPAPAQKPKQAGQQAGLKHFSDLEN